MTDFLATNPLTLSAAESPRFPFLNSRQTPTPRTQLNPNYRVPFSSKPSKTSCDNKSVSWALSSRSNEDPSRGYGFYNELEFEDIKEKTFGLERNPVGADSPTASGSVPFDGVEGADDKGEGDLVRVQGDADGDGDDLKKDDGVDQSENEKFGGKRVRRGKQVIRRSNLLAKQVISIRSALSMGFVSQLWVDTTSVSLESSCSISVLCSFFVLLACLWNTSFFKESVNSVCLFCCCDVLFVGLRN